jgi:TCP-1/cpn60 chaperonin family
MPQAEARPALPQPLPPQGQADLTPPSSPRSSQSVLLNGPYRRSHSAAVLPSALRGRAQDPALIWDEPLAMPDDFGLHHLAARLGGPVASAVDPLAGTKGSSDAEGREVTSELAWFDSQHFTGHPAAGSTLSNTADTDQLILSSVGRSAGAVPPVLQDVRRGLSHVSTDHLHRIVAQLMAVEHISDIPTWLPIVHRLAVECALLLSPSDITNPFATHKSLDPRSFVKVKKLADDSAPSSSRVYQGVVFSKNLTHRAMPRDIKRPRVLLLSGAIEYQKQARLLTMDSIIPQEAECMRACIRKAAQLKPDALLVEKSVSRVAQVCNPT